MSLFRSLVITHIKHYPLLLFLAAFTALVAAGAAPFRYPEPGLDPSWQQALVEATDSGRIFGRDIMFTYGPFHQAVTDQVSGRLTPLVLSRLLFTIIWFLTVFMIGSSINLWAASSIAISVFLLSGSHAGPQGDALFYLFSLLGIVATYSIWHSKGDDSGTPERVVLPVLFVSGVLLATLVKLSLLGAAIPVLTVVYGFQVLYVLKQKSMHSVFMAALTLLLPVAILYLAWGLSVGWSAYDLIGYYTSLNIDIVKGYTDAMSYGPSRLSLALASIYFLSFFLIVILFCKLFLHEIGSVDLRLRVSQPNALLVLLSLIMLSWVVFKSAFVRDDGLHTVLGALFLISFQIVIIGFEKEKFLMFLGATDGSFAVSASLAPLILSSLLAVLSGYRPPLNVFSSLAKGLADVTSLFTDRGRDLVVQQREDVLAQIKTNVEDYRVPPGSTADIIPWDVTFLLSNRLSYRPRPIPQSYSVYSQSLQKANKDFFLKSAERPEFLIIDVKDIDGRLPIGLDSAAIMGIESLYSFSHKGSKGSLVFRYDSSKQSLVNQELQSNCVRQKGVLSWQRIGRDWFSNTIGIPDTGSGPLTLTTRLKDSSSRSLLSTLWRPFPVTIEYLDQSGTPVESFRFIPKAGLEIVIYPIIKTNEDLFSVLASGDTSWRRGREDVASVRLATRNLDEPFEISKYLVSESCSR